MIFVESIGNYHVYREFDFNRITEANSIWEQIDNICRKELYSYIQFTRLNNIRDRFCEYVSQIGDVDDWLSSIEIGCVALTVLVGQNQGEGVPLKPLATLLAKSTDDLNSTE
jgi:hypothetical protein